MSSVYAFLDASCLVTDSLGCLLGDFSAAWVRGKVFDLTDSSATIIWVCKSFCFHIVEDNASDITKGLIALPFDMLYALVHTVLCCKEASCAVLRLHHPMWDESFAAALLVSGHRDNSGTTACLSS